MRDGIAFLCSEEISKRVLGVNPAADPVASMR